MTIEQVKAQVTNRDLETRTVHVQTTLQPQPLRLIGIGRAFLRVMNNDGNVRRIDPIIITEIRM